MIKTERKKWKRKTDQGNKRLLERRRGERERKKKMKVLNKDRDRKEEKKDEVSL